MHTAATRQTEATLIAFPLRCKAASRANKKKALIRRNKGMLTQVVTITAYQKCYSLLSKDGASAVRLFERGAEREAGEVVRSQIELAIRRGPATVTG